MDSSLPDKKPKARIPHQALVAKIFHWINIISLLLMIASGLQIYNANPVFGGRGGWHFPRVLALGGWLAGGRDWHFAIMWIYSLNLLCYGCYIFITRRWQHRFAGGNDVKAVQVSQNAKRINYAWHRLVYTAIIPVLLLAIISGLAMYKPAQFHGLASLFGNWQTLRTVHFLTVPIVLLFALAHSLLALKVGGSRLVQSMFL
ncbi:thiosulfate reductase cytochrome B subunit (membrane anchoring protein) [Leptolyngbya sp. 'hensonii']|uniref:cytochrome b/b6 domain-containing protein n=1 Tax=Leptolyngbya sp. 'hensonii' TaxID=1922337 RepID=UPI00094FA5F4|nr:cytochrome b/b6 domain-containing protein [Leptolyngbya sp. 'hensonii']OLP16954.1 thiosulfate reductase cytochrome B subunit (membrane anchoring protein) [Leptolyngbya sp. 'hensonii']